MIGYLRTHVRKQPMVALYFEHETVLKFYNLEARYDTKPTLLSYLLLQPPHYGHLELSLEPGMIQSPPCSPISCYSLLLWTFRALFRTRYDTEPILISYLLFQPPHYGHLELRTRYDTEPTLLSYLLLQPPQYGHLELSLEPGMKQSQPYSPTSCYSLLSMDI